MSTEKGQFRQINPDKNYSSNSQLFNEKF